MADETYGLTAGAVKKTADTVRRVQGATRGGGQNYGDAVPNIPPTHLVRFTSLTPNQYGQYPGVIRIRDPDTRVYVDGEEVWLETP